MTVLNNNDELENQRAETYLKDLLRICPFEIQFALCNDLVRMLGYVTECKDKIVKETLDYCMKDSSFLQWTKQSACDELKMRLLELKPDLFGGE